MQFMKNVPCLCLSLFFFIVLAPSSAFSANSTQPEEQSSTVTTSAPPNTPAASSKNTMPVAVEFKGSDTIGADFSVQLQGILNRSSLFELNNSDVPKIKIIIQTESEFTSRPEVGSAYAISWLYLEKSTVLPSYLSSKVGVTSSSELASLAIKTAEETSSIAARYAYLFK